MEANIDYWDTLRETKRYPEGGYYESQTRTCIRTEALNGESEIEIFEKFYKKNNQLRYCNGSYYLWTSKEWDDKYAAWLKSDDYKAKSFNLFYGNGVVD